MSQCADSILSCVTRVDGILCHSVWMVSCPVSQRVDGIWVPFHKMKGCRKTPDDRECENVEGI